MSEKNLLIIDTDCGVDDAVAILLTLSFPDSWQVLAITCCHGNTAVDNVCGNVLRVLNLCGKTDIPVYRGCEKALVQLQVPDPVFGDDGLGNVAHEYSCGSQQIREEHAVSALVKLARENAKRVHLLALGPLTNIAMAHGMDPQFTANIKSLVFMGGNVHGVGNTTNSAEYNFACDPESAHIVLSEVLCPTTMVPWETTLEHAIPWVFYEQWILKESPISLFLRKITRKIADRYRDRKRSGFLVCDALAAALLLDPACLESTVAHTISVETSGFFTRGQAIIERRVASRRPVDNPITIAMSFNDSRLLNLFTKIV